MKAPHPKARAAHLELARRFEEFADAAIVRDQHLVPDLLNA